MSDYGFVYILHNPQMLCIKIGCTERSPHSRAEELSNPTGAPVPFRVLCYVEVRKFQAFERQMHEWLKASRVNQSREFFSEDCLRFALCLMYHWPDRLAFAVVDEDYILEYVGDPVEALPNPWAPKAAVAFDADKETDVVSSGQAAEVVEPF